MKAKRGEGRIFACESEDVVTCMCTLSLSICMRVSASRVGERLHYHYTNLTFVCE